MYGALYAASTTNSAASAPDGLRLNQAYLLYYISLLVLRPSRINSRDGLKQKIFTYLTAGIALSVRRLRNGPNY
jgi:hypothetical protein